MRVVDFMIEEEIVEMGVEECKFEGVVVVLIECWMLFGVE